MALIVNISYEKHRVEVYGADGDLDGQPLMVLIGSIPQTLTSVPHLGYSELLARAENHPLADRQIIHIERDRPSSCVMDYPTLQGCGGGDWPPKDFSLILNENKAFPIPMGCGGGDWPPKDLPAVYRQDQKSLFFNVEKIHGRQFLLDTRMRELVDLDVTPTRLPHISVVSRPVRCDRALTEQRNQLVRLSSTPTITPLALTTVANPTVYQPVICAMLAIVHFIQSLATMLFARSFS